MPPPVPAYASLWVRQEVDTSGAGVDADAAAAAAAAGLSLDLKLDSTLGALFVGVLVSVLLFGLLMNQIYVYTRRFARDTKTVKGLVAGVWLCELAHVICISHMLYTLVITNFAHPERLGTLPDSLGASTVFNGIVASVVQGFFAYRIYRLSKSLLIPLLSWTLSLLFFIGNISLFVLGLESDPAKKWAWLLDTTWSLAAANDLLIAVTLVVLLLLIAGTVETGLLTSAAAILNLVCFVAMKNNLVWIAWYMITARLYSNSFLASLNSRESLRKMNDRQLTPRTRTHTHTRSPSMQKCDCDCHGPAQPGLDFSPFKFDAGNGNGNGRNRKQMGGKNIQVQTYDRDERDLDGYEGVRYLSMTSAYPSLTDNHAQSIGIPTPIRSTTSGGGGEPPLSAVPLAHTHTPSYPPSPAVFPLYAGQNSTDRDRDCQRPRPSRGEPGAATGISQSGAYAY
ncbi:hypothetical protein MKEN_00850200 [Mycena kentingensis (nom. inval.)]|nr:hypothetical protein MKEN_00850200 [Mycena kentingensis (nom. inval.)]